MRDIFWHYNFDFCISYNIVENEAAVSKIFCREIILGFYFSEMAVSRHTLENLLLKSTLFDTYCGFSFSLQFPQKWNQVH